MPGNSSRRGAIKKTGKGNPTAGSGGRVRRGLEGKGPTPKAKDREGHKVYKARQKAERAKSARPRRAAQPGDTEWVAGRNSVVEALRARMPIRTVYVAETESGRLWAFDIERPGVASASRTTPLAPHKGRLVIGVPGYGVGCWMYGQSTYFRANSRLASIDAGVSPGLPTINPPTTYRPCRCRTSTARCVALPVVRPCSRCAFFAAARRNARS